MHSPRSPRPLRVVAANAGVLLGATAFVLPGCSRDLDADVDEAFTRSGLMRWGEVVVTLQDIGVDPCGYNGTDEVLARWKSSGLIDSTSLPHLEK